MIDLRLPLSWLYGLGVRLHNPGVSALKASLPVISVGNLEVGGTGKTPMAAALCQALADRGRRPAILSRGYGGKMKGPLRVDPDQHRFDQVGDEPLMLARAGLPVFIGGDRAKSAALAQSLGHDLVILDDGHATKSVVKDYSILVFRAGFSGAKTLLPHGRLREPLERGLARADFAIVNGALTSADSQCLDQAGVRHLMGRFDVAEPDETGEQGQKNPKSQKYVLVTGIANPKRVAQTARAKGWPIVAHRVFPDHHAFTDQELRALRQECQVLDAHILTTPKDIVRMPEMDDVTTLEGQWRPGDLHAQRTFDALVDRLSDL